MDRALLHERVYALKYVLEGGQADLGPLQKDIEMDLDKVKTANDGMIDPDSVSERIMEIVQATLDNEH
ncbi:hypothetical protein ACFFGV_15700 [Pontibacillus salicampi]|uniref:Uncharacterized protein n=1 Tax=Pontibacillus salicampi TaxID=1449801 RepID=A0ABV6LRI7_9BACI